MSTSTNCWLWLLKLAGHTIGAWLALSLSAIAAEPMGLDFDLAKSDLSAERPIAQRRGNGIAPVPAIEPPKLPVAGREVPIGSEAPKPLPPPPELERSIAAETAESPPQVQTVQAIDRPTEPSSKLNFALQSKLPKVDLPIAPSRSEVDRPSPPQPDLFAGGSESLLAKAIGSAEGTRTPTGGYIWAYRGHVDPGNSAWNLGSFSYQHGADSPQAADRKQLARLQTQAETLRQQADRYQMNLTLAETLNGLDLANQSPRAALSRGGYIDRLHQAHDMGLRNADAILWARTRAFLDPDTNRWNAPGLGNNVHSITADQDRRRRSIEQAIAHHD